MELAEPSAKYKASYIEAIKEFLDDHSFPLMDRKYDKLSIPDLESDFESYVEKIRAQSKGEGLPEGWVPATVCWLVDGHEYIGAVNIRHRLTPHLEQIGGHIGYDIRPSKRRERVWWQNSRTCSA